jgi:hypothetical protein
MRRDEALERLAEIQRIAETTTLYTLLPGHAAIIGGVLVFIGCIVSYAMIRSADFAQLINCSMGHQLVFLGVWAVIGAVAIGQELILANRDARRQGIALYGRPGKLSAYSLTPNILIAVVLSIQLFIDADPEAAMRHIRYIAPIWMMCYGTGVYAAGLFSVRLPRLLGISFIIMGAAGLLFFASYGLLLVALSFGLLHIVFGMAVLRRIKRNQEP